MKKSWILLISIILVMISGCATDPDVYTLFGLRALNKGEYSNAISDLKTATELEPRDGASFGWLCQAYYKNGQYHEAIEACKKSLNLKRAAESYPQNGDTFRWLCYAYYGNHQYHEAVDACNKSLNLPHNKNLEYDTWKYIGMARYNLGQIDSGISSLKKSIELKPDEEDTFTSLSLLYKSNKQYDEAITAAKRAIELKSDSAAAYTNLGAAYGEKKQYDEAIKALKKAIEIDPKDSDPYDWMGYLLMEKNAYNDAAETYKKGIEVAPSNLSFREALAVAYYRMGRYDDAIATANRAIELQTIPGGLGISIAIEAGYPVVKEVMETGPAKKAGIEARDKIIKIDGKSTKGWNLEQVTQSLRGTSGTQVVLTIERKGAEKTIDKTVTRETTSTAGAALSFGLRSLAYRHKGSLEAALTDAEKAYSLDSANDYARLSLGAAYLDRGQYDESIKLLAQVKDSPRARLYEATAYAKQGKTQEAVNIYFSIPEEEMSPKNIPLMNDRMALLQTFKPIVKEHRDKARTFESKGQYQEALAELSEALKIADDTEAQAIQETTFSMLRRNPLLAEMPEDARKYALRSEVLLKEGNLEQAATELKKAIQIAPYAARLYYSSALINAELKRYPEAIRHMKIYLKAVPDAPDARAVKDEMIKWEFMMEKGK